MRGSLAAWLSAFGTAFAAAAAFGVPTRPTLESDPVERQKPAGNVREARAASTDTIWIADWSFDEAGGGCTDAGWVKYDNRILNDGSNYWSIDTRFSGTGWITNQAAVLAKHDLAWPRDGYGNDWDYSIILKYRGGSTLSFDYLSDSEPNYDFVSVEADSAGASEARVDYTLDPRATPDDYRLVLLSVDGPQSATAGPIALTDFGVPATVHEVYIRFQSDSGYSDEDGLYTTAWNAGLVVDGIVVTGELAYSENFEAALGPNVTLANTAPATPFGEWARVYAHVTDNDVCTENTTCSWLWSDPTRVALYPDMAFGPGAAVVRNWLDDAIVSPWVSLAGTPGATVTFLSYRRFPGNDYNKGSIVQNWSVRSRIKIDNTDTSAPGDSLLAVGPWQHASSWNSLTTFTWNTYIGVMSNYIAPGASEIQIRFRVGDFQSISAAPPPVTLDPGPGPYVDRVRIGRLTPTGPSISLVPSWATAADGFASARNTTAPGENFSPAFDRFGTIDFAQPMVDLGQGGSYGDSATYNTRDSLVVSVLDTRMTGELWVGLFASIASGPHAGKAPPPWAVGGNGFFVVDADSSRYPQNGDWIPNYWWVDLDDEYLRGGDRVVYFWAATDGAGGFSSMPPGLVGVPTSVAQAQEATGGLYEFEALPVIDWDPAYIARVAADPSGKVDPTPTEIANSRQRTSILYVWQRPWARQSGAAHKTAFMHTLDELGYQDLYDRFFITTYFASYLGHLAARASIEQATSYELIIQDSERNNWNVLPPPDYRERPVPQVQWYRDWLARAPLSEAGRATLWLLGNNFVAFEGDNPLVQQDMGVAIAHDPQTLLPYPEIAGQVTFTWASGDSTDFTGDRLVLATGAQSCPPNRYNTGLAATGTAVVTHRYTLGATLGDGAVVMNANAPAGWNTILGSFSWEDLLSPPGSPAGDRQAALLDGIFQGALSDSVRALPNPTDVPDRTAGLPRATVLRQNVPNPFNPATTIRFDLAQSGAVKLEIFDVGGRRVKTLVDGPLLAGWNHRVTWNGLDAAGTRVASGIYFYRLRTGSSSSTRKMIVLK